LREDATSLRQGMWPSSFDSCESIRCLLQVLDQISKTLFFLPSEFRAGNTREVGYFLEDEDIALIRGFPS